MKSVARIVSLHEMERLVDTARSQFDSFETAGVHLTLVDTGHIVCDFTFTDELERDAFINLVTWGASDHALQVIGQFSWSGEDKRSGHDRRHDRPYRGEAEGWESLVQAKAQSDDERRGNVDRRQSRSFDWYAQAMTGGIPLSSDVGIPQLA